MTENSGPDSDGGGLRIKRRKGVDGWLILGLLIFIFYVLPALYLHSRSPSKIGDAAKFKQLDADFKLLESALAMYKLNAGSYPSTEQGLDALVVKPALQPVPRRWSQAFERLHWDPWGQPYLYRFPGKKRLNEFEIFSKGADGILGTADDVSSQDE